MGSGTCDYHCRQCRRQHPTTTRVVADVLQNLRRAAGLLLLLAFVSVVVVR